MAQALSGDPFSHDGIVVDFAALTMGNLDRGTNGQRVEVLTNHFRIVKSPPVFYEYKIEYARLPSRTIAGKTIPGREIKRRDEKRLVYEQLREIQPLSRILHEHAVNDDFTTIWATKSGGREIRITDIMYTRPHGDSQHLDYILLVGTRKIEFSNTSTELVGTPEQPNDPKPVLQILNAFVRSAARFDEKLIQVGPSKFFIKDESESIDSVLEVKRGFNVEVRACQEGPLVNINTACKCFYKAVNLVVLIKYVGRNVGRDLDVLKNLRVSLRFALRMPGTFEESSTTPERVIHSFGLPLSQQKLYGKPEQAFPTLVLDQIRRDNVAHGLDHTLPCVNIGFDNAALAQWVPAEWITLLPHQPAHEHVAESAVSKVIVVAAKNADFNRDRVKTLGLSTLSLANPNILANAGFLFSDALVAVESRYLDSPSITYGTGSASRPDVVEASWNLAKIRKMERMGSMKCLHILFIRDSKQGAASVVLNAFATSMTRQLQYHGFQGMVHKFKECIRDRVEQDLDGVFAAYAQEKVNLVLVVLPDEANSLIYRTAKRLGSLKHGINTTMCTLEKTKKDSKQLASNIILKLNVNSGGVNQVLEKKQFLSKLAAKENIVILGADVIHNIGGGKLYPPSIAAVVGSVDHSFAVYPASMRLQRPLQEQIEDMEPMVLERLQAWASKNAGRVPSMVFFYRDGVGDSQFDIVRSQEIPAIERAWNKIFEGKPLKLNLYVVSKRHQQRLYPKEDCAQQDTSRFGNNVKPGICVDTSITHPWQKDFYLGAHAAIKGTMRPAHYYPLRNDSELNSDDIQTLAHELSYLHPICSRGVSYAAPAFAADRACESTKALFDHGMDPFLARRRDESVFQFRDRCLKYALSRNPQWNRPGRPGPWHPNLDHVPHYL